MSHCTLFDLDEAGDLVIDVPPAGDPADRELWVALRCLRDDMWQSIGVVACRGLDVPANFLGTGSSDGVGYRLSRKGGLEVWYPGTGRVGAASWAQIAEVADDPRMARVLELDGQCFPARRQRPECFNAGWRDPGRIVAQAADEEWWPQIEAWELFLQILEDRMAELEPGPEPTRYRVHDCPSCGELVVNAYLEELNHRGRCAPVTQSDKTAAAAA